MFWLWPKSTSPATLQQYCCKIVLKLEHRLCILEVNTSMCESICLIYCCYIYSIVCLCVWVCVGRWSLGVLHNLHLDHSALRSYLSALELCLSQVPDVGSVIIQSQALVYCFTSWWVSEPPNNLLDWTDWKLQILYRSCIQLWVSCTSLTRPSVKHHMK